MNAHADAMVMTVRHAGRVPMVLRGVVATSSIVALVATIAPAWGVPDGYVWIAALFAIAACTVPDSAAGMCFAVSIVLAWVTGAPGGVGPAVVVCALALLAGHVAGALAAAMPATASADLRLALRWWRPTAVIAGGILATAALAVAVDAWSPPGSLILVVAALVAATFGIWWWSGASER